METACFLRSVRDLFGMQNRMALFDSGCLEGIFPLIIIWIFCIWNILLNLEELWTGVCEFVRPGSDIRFNQVCVCCVSWSPQDKRMKCWWSWALSLVLINLLSTQLNALNQSTVLLKDLLNHAHTRPAVTEPLQRSQHRFWTLERSKEKDRGDVLSVWMWGRHECKEGGVRSKVGPPSWEMFLWAEESQCCEEKLCAGMGGGVPEGPEPLKHS